MNQKGFANIVLVILVVVLAGAVGYFAFVHKSTPITPIAPTSGQATSTPIVTSPPVTNQTPPPPVTISGDPFGAPPKGTSPNCGPEDRYKFNIAINSKNDFVNFIKNNQVNLGAWVRLDNFKDRPNGDVDWDKVLASITPERIGGKTVYVLNYNPATCSGFTLKMTDDGHVSNYGCCGV